MFSENWERIKWIAANISGNASTYLVCKLDALARFAVKFCTSHLNLVLDWDVINVERDKTAKIIFHDFDKHFDKYIFMFFLLLASPKKVF